jgi:hypothetical protein
MTNATFTAEQLREAAEYAPPSGRTAEGLRGVRTYGNLTVCAHCVGRITARGLGHFVRGEHLWDDDPTPAPDTCVVCGSALGRVRP